MGGENRFDRLKMKKFSGIYILALLCIWVVSCSEQTPEETFASAEAAAADSSQADRAVQLFADFLARYPQHQLSAKALKHLAHITQQKGDKQGAIAYYERLLTNFSDSEYGAEAQFMIGFIYEEDLKDFDRARQAYQQVIDNYPDSELAESARHLLPYIGRDPEEWVPFQDRK